jgi:hypothetical protein
MRRQASIGNMSVEQLIAGKLGYEWKNIYRNFVQIDLFDSG